MKFSTLFGLLALSTYSVAADSSEVAFITKLVEDAKSHKADYLKYVKTATESVPAEFTSLARKVITYKDKSYTTLIDKEKLNVSELESFATELPWYKQRLATGSDDSSSASSDSKSSSKSSKSSSSSSKGSGNTMAVPVGTGFLVMLAALL